MNTVAPTTRAVRRNIGVAPQALALYGELTADENLRFFGSLYDLTGNDLEKRIESVLDDVGLTERRSDRVATFFGRHEETP